MKYLKRFNESNTDDVILNVKDILLPISDMGYEISVTDDVDFNGKLTGIKEHLSRQDTTLNEVKVLLEERKFLAQLWSLCKFAGGLFLINLS